MNLNLFVMRKIILSFVLLIISVQITQAQTQTDSVAWQFYGGSYIKTDTAIIGNDTLSVYNGNIYLKEGGDTTFYYKNGQLNFLYANHAQVGDIWHPLNTLYYVPDTCHLSLKVKYIDSVLISGQWLKRFSLCVINQSGETTPFVSVVEKIGVFDGVGHSMGMLYEGLPVECDGSMITDYPTLCLISYYSEALNYTYIRSNQSSCFSSIETNTSVNLPLIKRTDNRIEVTWNDNDVELELYTISGQKVKLAQKNSMVLPQEQGIYFLHILQGKQFRVVKLAN